MRVDDELLAAVDQAAASQETRSAFIRSAVQAEVKRRRNATLEKLHRQSYQAQPDDDTWYPAVRAWAIDDVF